MSTQEQINDKLVLVGGKSAGGKSASLMKLNKPEGVLYLNCEAGKKLPFRSKFIEKTITDPLQVIDGFAWAETQENVHTIVIDTLTYLLDMYESLYIIGLSDGRSAWGQFAQYFKNLMQQTVASSTKNIIFLAHTMDVYNDADLVMETKVPVKGALKNNGIESYFSIVISAKKMSIKALKDYKSELLTITPEEEALGFKYVFQTRLTKESMNERLRGPLGLFSVQETYMDNDMQLVLNKLHEYYD